MLFTELVNTNVKKKEEEEKNWSHTPVIQVHFCGYTDNKHFSEH